MNRSIINTINLPPKKMCVVLFFTLTTFFSCLRADPAQEIGLLIDSAGAKVKIGDYAGAIEDSTRAIVLDPKSAKAFYIRGFAKGHLKDFNGAIDDYTKAIILNPKYEIAYFNRGATKCMNGDNSGGIADYSMVITLNPENADAYYYRGETKAFSLDDHEGAIADFTKAIELNPTNAWAYNDRATEKYDLNKDLVGAIADLDKAIELIPESAVFYNDRGALKRVSKDYSDAIADLNKAIELNPRIFQAYLGLGLIDNDLFQLQPALTNFKQSLALEPTQWEIENRVCLIRIQLGEQKEVTEEVEHNIDTPEYKTIKMESLALGEPLPFSYALIDEFLVNIVSENEIFQSATNSTLSGKIQNEHLCTVYYYAGMKRLIAGDKSGATNFFQKCVNLNQGIIGENGYDEHGSAEAELNALRK